MVLVSVGLAAWAAALAMWDGAPARRLVELRPPLHGPPPDPGRDGRRLRLAAGGGAAATVILLVPGPIGVAVAAAVFVAVWMRSARWETASVRRRRERLRSQLPHVVDLMVASLGSGDDPGAALARVAHVSAPPIREELSAWVRRLELGADPATVWRDLARHPELGRLGGTLLRSAESGAPVLAALTRLAQELRSRRRAEVEARVRQVEVKAAVPLGVCLLPSFVLVGVVPLVAGSALGFVVR